MNRKYAVLDFDGTLIKGQSQRMLVKYLYKKGYITFTRYARIMLWYVGFKLGVAHDVKKIGNYAVGYLTGKKVADFKPIFDDFFTTECIPRIYKDSYELVAFLKEHGYGTTLLSTAIDPIISRACEHFGADEFICTRLAVQDDVYLGTISGEPVYADNKARIIEEYAPEHGVETKDIYAFADHMSDAPLLSTVGHPVLVNPAPKLLAYAQREKWPVVYLDEHESLQYFKSHTLLQ